jgi:hypothetical protein
MSRNLKKSLGIESQKRICTKKCGAQGGSGLRKFEKNMQWIDKCGEAIY